MVFGDCLVRYTRTHPLKDLCARIGAPMCAIFIADKTWRYPLLQMLGISLETEPEHPFPPVCLIRTFQCSVTYWHLEVVGPGSATVSCRVCRTSTQSWNPSNRSRTGSMRPQDSNMCPQEAIHSLALNKQTVQLSSIGIRQSVQRGSFL